MAGKQLAGALMAGAAVVGMITAPAAAGEVSEIAPSCPAGTIHSGLVAGDDFAPDTEPSATWESRPAGRFGVEQDASASDGWLMHGGYAEDGTGGRATMTSWVQMPEGRRLVLVMKHSFALAKGSQAYVWIDAADASPPPDVPHLTGSANGAFTGTRAAMTSTADISDLEGRTVQFSVRMSGGEPAAEATGWDIDSFTIYTCDDDQPSAPTAVASKPGYSTVETTWQPPGWRPEDVDGYQVRLVDVADASRNKTVNVAADVRQWRFPGLPAGRSYRVDVGTGGRFTAGPTMRRSAIPLTVPVSQTLTYSNHARLDGDVTCDNGAFGNDPGKIVLQRRYQSSARWVGFARADAYANGWSEWPVPTRHTEYRALFLPGTYDSRTCMGRISQTVKVRVRMAVSAGTTKYPYLETEPVVVKGSVKPAHPRMRVYLQRYYSSGWRSVSSQQLSSTSTYRFTFRKSEGRYKYRVLAPTHSDHLGAASHSVYVVVRD